MDDLQLISTMLTKPEPAPEVVERGRRRLIDGAGPVVSRRRTVKWTSAGLGLTAAAAAAAVLVVSQTSAPTPTTNGPPAGAAAAAPDGSRQLSGPEVLRSAAEYTLGKPDRTGTYWHLLQTFPQPDGAGPVDQETWTGRDGRSWVRVGANSVRPMNNPPGFTVAYDQLTYAQLQALPTDPAALTARIQRSFTHPTGQQPRVGSKPGGRVPADGAQLDPLPERLVPSETAIQLAYLLYRVPAPAAVKAAAFQALAAMPVVRNLGPVAGGQRLRITLPHGDEGKWDGKPPAGYDRIDLVVDPTTGTLRSFVNYQGTQQIKVAEWTDRLPR